MKIKHYDDWGSFFSTAQVLSNQEKGLQFELLTANVLMSHPIYASRVEKVWLLREGVPTELKNVLNIPNTDEGIDIIAKTFSGDYWAIQCKFKASKEPPTMKELSTFNNLAHTHCKNISLALLFHTGERGVRKKHLMGEKYAEVGLEFWLGLKPENWKSINDYSNSKKLKPIKRSPRDHQKGAIKSAQDHFIKKGNSRGRLIMPCGTGKSLTAFWIANGLKANSIIVAVPSLNLIKQSLEDWTTEFIAQNETPRPEWQVICSDDSTSKIEDEFVNDVYSLGIPTSTNVDEIEAFLKRKTKCRKIIFTTYQSSDRLAQAARKAKFSFDLAILDEAHKTVGIKSKSFATLLSDTNISIKKRMFMTATERVIKGTNDDVLSMDDESIYGKRFYQLTFKDAIHSSPQIISDYKILTIAVTNMQIQEIIQKNKLLSDKKNKLEEQDAQTLAAAIALRQATNKYGITHAISFHKSIKAAESFTNLNLRLNTSKVDKFDISSYHISSKKSAGQRSQLMDDFKADKLALMTNARCLTEGVNVPAIDCVLFADPKQSIVDIVQAAGRALRVSPGKKYGYIMMPLIVPDNMELEDFTETTPFKQISRIVAALSTQDERIVEEFRLIDQGKRVSDRRVEITGSIPVGLNLDITSFAASIEAKYWEKVGRANWLSFEEAKAVVRGLGLKNTSEWNNYYKSDNRLKNIPTSPQIIYKNQGWKGMPDFLGNDNVSSIGRLYLNFNQAREFVHSLKFKSVNEYRNWSKSGKRPTNIPGHPAKIYKFDGYLSWSDWLGLKIGFYGEFLSFSEAKEFVKPLNLKSTNEWRNYCRSGSKPHNIPSNPRGVYKESGWISMSDFLSSKPGFIRGVYWDFKRAHKFVKSLNLAKRKDWVDYCKSGKKPLSIPSEPNLIYKNHGFTTFQDWLGSNYVSNFKKIFYTFNDAKEFVIKLNLKSESEWRLYVKSGTKPSFIPSSPPHQYKNSGWSGWSDFLGKN
jgi:superfamily II DNA or RNA helicase